MCISGGQQGGQRRAVFGAAPQQPGEELGQPGREELRPLAQPSEDRRRQPCQRQRQRRETVASAADRAPDLLQKLLPTVVDPYLAVPTCAAADAVLAQRATLHQPVLHRLSCSRPGSPPPPSTAWPPGSGRSTPPAAPSTRVLLLRMPRRSGTVSR